MKKTSHIHRRAFSAFGTSIFGLGVLAYSGLTGAQAAYPSKPITIVVPHAAGGAVDSVARFYANKLKDELKESVVVENRAGASGMIGAEHVARAPADGYTLYVNASIHSINPLLYKKAIRFDAVKDFTAISMLAQGALIFSVNPQVPANTVAELITEIKANPKRYSFATSGFGSAGHLGAAQFLYKTQLTQVPIVLYKGAAPALQDLVGGQVQAMMDPMLSSLPFVKSGKLRALAVTGDKRSPLLPDVPTLREAGLADQELYSWYGLWGPANLPPAVMKKLNDASARIMAQPDMNTRLVNMGFEPAYKNAATFEKFIDEETARYRAIIARANITVE
jgi:tripartite-type tricarboxylate transporter receptor subunit TctC